MRRFKSAIAATGALATLVACSEETDSSVDPTIGRGEMIYRNVCVVCHNADPNEPGVLGPPIAQATRALLEAKVLRGEYPAGHAPARDTQQMPQFAYLEPNLGDIEAYIASRRK